MEGFWQYVSSADRDDRLRHMVSAPARNLGRTLPKRTEPNFKWIIADALFQRVTQSSRTTRLIIESEAPFDMYYLYKTQSGIMTPIRHKDANWMVPIYEEIRKALKENRVPDFSRWGEDPNKELLEVLNNQPTKIAKKRNKKKKGMSDMDKATTLSDEMDSDIIIDTESTE